MQFTRRVPARRAIAAGLLLLGAAAGRAAAQEAPPAPGTVRLVRDPYRGLGLKAEDAALPEIFRQLERVTGCRVELPEPLRERRMTVTLGARAPELLYVALARRLFCRMSVLYRFEPFPLGGTRRVGSRVFASEPVEAVTETPVPLEEALRVLPGSYEVDPEVRGAAKLLAVRHPLCETLDGLADQVRARWRTVIRLEERRFVDADAEAHERMIAHYHDLAPLSSSDRVEELEADVRRIEKLPPEEQQKALGQMAADVLSLGSYLHEQPGEHRGPLWTGVLGIAGDYTRVLGRMPVQRRALFTPVVRALYGLRRRLESIH